MDFENIILEEEQTELFIQIVEIIKAIPRDKRQIMLLIKSLETNSLLISSKDNKRYDIDNIVDGDLYILTQNGLLNISYTKQGTEQYYITPKGFKYYEYIMKEMGKPVERIQSRIFKYLESEDFKNNYSGVFQKLRRAEDMLWSSDRASNFTEIGHNCREAMQEFADELYFEVFKKRRKGNISNTVDRIRDVINKKSLSVGKTEKNFLEALLPFWGTVSDLVQRQEHGAQKEGEELTWEDARRVVFQTANIMFELHRSLLNFGNKQ